jgi:hypothetical protein
MYFESAGRLIQEIYHQFEPTPIHILSYFDQFRISKPDFELRSFKEQVAGISDHFWRLHQQGCHTSDIDHRLPESEACCFN